ncbi:MAG: hypothetical protein SVX43_11950 [Cyanobacteriota bacterium]|nr:hypothetical protein [Cyanobacteriota bacterium]
MKKLRLTQSLLYGFLVGFGISVVFVSQNSGRAQMENSNPQNTSDNLAPSTRSPVATQRGMDELKATLAASDPTDDPSIRRVVITIPAGGPDFMRLREASSTAIRVFHLVAGESLTGSPINAEYGLESSQGVRGRLPNGGTIALRIRKVNEDNGRGNIGEILIRDHQIPGYEQVERIEFVSE